MTKFIDDETEQLYIESLDGFGPTYGSVDGPGFLVQLDDTTWIHEDTHGFVTKIESEGTSFGVADTWVKAYFPEIWNWDASDY